MAILSRSGSHCEVCEKPLEGRQKFSCSPACRRELARRRQREAILTHVARIEEACRALRRVVGEG